MVSVVFDSNFKKSFVKIKNKSIKKRLIKQISKIKNNPKLGKPMMYNRKGTRELYVKPYRLSYIIEDETIYILSLYHKDEQ